MPQLGGGGGRPPTSIPAGPAGDASGGNPGIAMSALSTSSSSAATQTALDITDSPGVLDFAGIVANIAGVTITATLLKVTIDGVIVYNETGSLLNITSKTAVGAFWGDSGVAGGVFAGSMPFKSSCKIEYAADGTNLINCYYRYYLT